MENYPTGNEEIKTREGIPRGDEGEEEMRRWKNKAWHKMKEAQHRMASYWSGMDHETQKKVWTGVGIAAAVGFVLGILIGKGSRKH